MKRMHIGDGVYASFDGWHIWLTAEVDGKVHSIALEPPVVQTFMDFVDDVLKGHVEPTQAPR